MAGDNGPLRISGTGYVLNPTEFTLGQYTSLRAYLQMPGGNSGQIEIWNGGTANPILFNNYGIGLNGEIPTSGSGIQFSAVQQASSNANCLDDYEEGTWTPAFTFSTSGSVTYAVQSGGYVKVGGLVTVTANIALSGVSSPSGYVTIGNLPFSTPGGSEKYVAGAVVALARNLASSGLVIRAYKQASGTVLTISKNNTDGVHVDLEGSDLTSSTALYMTLTYLVS